MTIINGIEMDDGVVGPLDPDTPVGAAANLRDEIIGPGWCDACGEYVEKLLVINQRGIAGLCSCQKCAGSGWPNNQAQRPCSASLSSPALKHQSEIYPPRYRGRVPWKIKMACTVRPDLEWLCKTRGTVAVMDEVYECWVNMHGAVAAICRNGEKLGIKPVEFDVVDWHTQTPNK